MAIKKIIDFISESEVICTPEEEEAVQPLARELYGIYGYSKEDIRTHPQYFVSPPSGGTKYPIDIAVFEEGKLKIIAECKKKARQDGVSQLHKYLNLSEALYGIWFNGHERKYFKKIFKKNGFEYIEVSSIPQKGIEDNNRLKKNDLKKYDNLKNIFQEMRTYLSTRSVGQTTGLQLAEDFIRVLFCKIYDERYKQNNDYLDFYCLETDDVKKVYERINQLFSSVKKQYNSVFESNEKIFFDPETVYYIVNRLQYISLMSSQRDAIAEAFEIFVGQVLKGEQGQFFTPRNVIRFVLNYLDINYLDINSSLTIMDPACGTGGFIVEALDFVWKKIDKSDKSHLIKTEEKTNFANFKIYGVDKDKFVSKVTKAYMCIMGDGTTHVENKNSLNSLEPYYKKVDLIITNPPFGKKIKINDEKILKKYSLAKKTEKKGTNPEILFIELCVNLLGDNGIMAIVVPEGILGNQQTKYVRQFLDENGKILSIISLPVETFKPHTGIKSSIIIFQKTKKSASYETLFLDIDKIGHDKNGKILYRFDKYGDPIKDSEGNFLVDDETKEILHYLSTMSDIKMYNDPSSNGKIFKVPIEVMRQNNLKMWPAHYSNFLRNKETYSVVEGKKSFSIRELIDDEVIFSTSKKLLLSGNSIESIHYDQNGDVPFLRTSDIKNLEIVRNPQKFVKKSFFDKLSKPCLQPLDILFASDGQHCVGETAIVMNGEEEALVQSHLSIFRLKENNCLGIDPYNLLAELNSEETINQIKSGIFVQGTIPTLSDNIYDVKLNFFTDKDELKKQSKWMKNIVTTRFELKQQIKVNW